MTKIVWRVKRREREKKGGFIAPEGFNPDAIST